MIGTKPSRGQLAAQIILSAPHFEGRAEVEDYVHDTWVDFPAMTENWPWRGGELVALNAAWSIYASAPHCPLSDVLSRLDQELFTRVLLACRVAYGLDEVPS